MFNISDSPQNQKKGLKVLKTLGNILWIIFGGALNALLWLLMGLLWCITIVGIPLGKQCFKFAKLRLKSFELNAVF